MESIVEEGRKNARARGQEECLENAISWTLYSHSDHNATVPIYNEPAQEWLTATTEGKGSQKDPLNLQP